jgi:gamma-glutamyl-gamma-aminobutyrate hydrolase PuuD
MRPLIGITGYAEEARFGIWSLPTALTPLAYIDVVDRLGGRPLVVPPSEQGVEETLDALDGIVFSGGSDLDPQVYGAEPHPETGDIRPERDRAELLLLRGALDRDMPVLATCRGSQVLNVARSGTLHQHLPELLGHERHRHEPGTFSEHVIDLDLETRLGRLLAHHGPVKSHHHQGFDRLGEGLEPFAWADDGTVEGIEAADRRFAVGVLWHPEFGEDETLFRALVDEARTYRGGRRAALHAT